MGRIGSTAPRDAGYLFFNFLSAVSATVINKHCFERVGFCWPASLSNLHLLITWTGVELLRRAGRARGGFEPLAVPRRRILRDRDFLAAALFVGVGTPLTNVSLKLNGVGFYQLAKLLVTPAVVSLEYALDGRGVSRPRAVALAATCLSVGAASLSDLELSFRGAACASAWVPVAAAYKVQWGRVLRKYDASTLAMMHAVLPLSMLVQAAVSPLFDPPGVFGFRWTPGAALWIGLSGVAAFFGNLSGFLVMGRVGALAHVLLGQLKTAVIMVASFLVFGTVYSPMQLVGAAAALLSIVSYTRITMQEKSADQRSCRARDSTEDLAHKAFDGLPLLQKRNAEWQSNSMLAAPSFHPKR